MFSLSEIIFFLILALVLIGPKQLPEVARTVARVLNELRRTMENVQSDIRKTSQSVMPHPSDFLHKPVDYTKEPSTHAHQVAGQEQQDVSIQPAENTKAQSGEKVPVVNDDKVQASEKVPSAGDKT